MHDEPNMNSKPDMATFLPPSSRLRNSIGKPWEPRPSQPKPPTPGDVFQHSSHALQTPFSVSCTWPHELCVYFQRSLPLGPLSSQGLLLESWHSATNGNHNVELVTFCCICCTYLLVICSYLKLLDDLCLFGALLDWHWPSGIIDWYEQSCSTVIGCVLVVCYYAPKSLRTLNQTTSNRFEMTLAVWYMGALAVCYIGENLNQSIIPCLIESFQWCHG